MLKFTKILAVAAGLTMASGAAMAATFTADYDVTANSDASVGLGILTDPDMGSFSVDLEVGDSTDVDLFLIYTTETTVNLDDLAPQPISVAFAFTSPSAMGTLGGTTVGEKSFLGFFQNGTVSFDAPLVIDFGTGGQISIALNDADYNSGIFWGLDEGIDEAAMITATITYVSASVPLPAGGLLLVTALGGAAALRRRKAV